MYFKGLWGYLPANIIQGIVGFLSLIVFTRLLSAEDYGRYALAYGVSSLGYTLFFTWIEAAMARYYPAEKREDVTAPILYGTLYRCFMAIALVFIGLSLLALSLWSGSEALKMAIGLGLMSAVTRSLLKLVQEQRRSEGRVAQAAMIDMAMTIGGFGLGVIFIRMGLGGGAILLGAGIMALCLLPFVAREDWGRAIKGRFDGVRLKDYAHYGFPIALSLILTLGLYTIDRFLVAHYLSEGDAGAYHAGYSLASRILDVLFIWFGAAGTPALIQALENGGVEALKAQARQQIMTMAIVLFPAVGGLIVVSEPLGSLMIGEALRERALLITPYIAIAALFSGLNSYYFLQAFTLAKRTLLLILAMSIPALANIALNIILIPTMGLIGSAIACCLSFGLGVLSAWALGLRVLALPVPIVGLTKLLGFTIMMMLACSIVPDFGHEPIHFGLNIAIKAIIGIVVYAGLVLAFDIEGLRGHGLRVYQQIRAKVGL